MIMRSVHSTTNAFSATSEDQSWSVLLGPAVIAGSVKTRCSFPCACGQHRPSLLASAALEWTCEAVEPR